MNEIQHSIDWLQYSADWPIAVREWPVNPEEEVNIIRTAIPHLHIQGLPPQRAKGDKAIGMRGYSRTFDMVYCTAHVHPEHRSEKIGVRFDGGCMGAWRDYGQTEERLIKFVNDIRATCSRVDIAFDLFDFGIDPLRLYDFWKRGKWSTRARSCRPFTEGIMGEDGQVREASTLYIGSRTSETMVRIYEKGKQLRVDRDWTRVEIELKGDKAQMAISEMNRLGIDVVGKQILRDFINMPYKFFKALTTGKSVALPKIGAKKTDRQIWLENIIIPLLREEMSNEWGELGDDGSVNEKSMMLHAAIESLVRDNWHARSQYIRDKYYPGLRS